MKVEVAFVELIFDNMVKINMPVGMGEVICTNSSEPMTS